MGDLVEFFKVLGEPNRLRIVGLLPAGVHRGTARRGLGRGCLNGVAPPDPPGAAGLVISRSESYYNLYSLKTDALSDMAKTLFGPGAARAPSQRAGAE